MKEINQHATIPYSPAKLFRLVNDIESYPQFLPWCTHAQIIQRMDDRLTASLSLAMGRLRQTIITANHIQVDRQIKMHLVKGPFRHLEGVWDFQPAVDDACLICFKMQFTFANKGLEYLLGKAFNKIISSFMDAFIDRAHALYGAPSQDQ